MKGKYEIVKDIERGSVSFEQLQEARRDLVRGSHIDLILQESLLDRQYDREALPEELAKHAADVIMTSFPDENFAGLDLLFRGEFLFLSYAGDDLFSWEEDRKPYLERIAEKVRRARPRSVIYRLTDYNSEDFSYLPGLDRLPESRGAQRLLDQPELLETDLAVIELLGEMNVPVDILVPCIQFQEQYAELAGRIRERAREKGIPFRSLGIMLEIPANLFQIDLYRDVDFFIFGPGDLLKYYYGDLNRNTALFNRIDPEIILPGILFCLEKLNEQGKKVVYLAKHLIGLGESIRDMGFSNLELRNLYLPSQIMNSRVKSEIVSGARV